jgi:hypothetical protein
MQWPWVSRDKYERLEERCDALEKINAELKEHSDKLLDSILKSDREDQERREQMPDPVQQPRRLFSKDLREKATAAMDKRHRERGMKA